jgi:hypothetical protein
MWPYLQKVLLRIECALRKKYISQNVEIIFCVSGQEVTISDDSNFNSRGDRFEFFPGLRMS